MGEKDLSNPRRDSTALTVFEVDLSTVDDPLISKPTYKVVFRKEWIGITPTLYGEIKAIGELFNIRFLVVDATGVGAGMTSFLAASMGEKVIPLNLIDRKERLIVGLYGNYRQRKVKSYQCSSEKDQCSSVVATFWEQVEFCQFEILPGPQKPGQVGRS